MSFSTVPVLGLPLAATEYAGAVEWCLEAAAAADRAVAVAAANTHLTTLARHEPAFGATMASFDLICPDGMPLVWAMNRRLPAEQKLTDRVYGPTLMLETIKETASRPDIRHFLLGGKQSTLDKLKDTFSRSYPGTNIAGTWSPPFGTWPAGESDRMIQAIRDSGANMVWVGLGCPKQENWIAAHKDRLPPAVYFAIGAAFAFHADEVSQAPKWIQDRGFEWLYRLCAEPRRLFKRYFVYNTLFLWYLMGENAEP